MVEALADEFVAVVLRKVDNVSGGMRGSSAGVTSIAHTCGVIAKSDAAVAETVLDGGVLGRQLLMLIVAELERGQLLLLIVC